MLTNLSNSVRDRKTDTQYAYSVVREAILQGQLRPGERLLVDRIGGEFGMSRTPIREALLMLESDGLVSSMPKRGTLVRTFTRREIDEIYRMRMILEGTAAKVAARHITGEQIRQLQAIHDTMGRRIAEDHEHGSEEFDVWLRYLVTGNGEFHSILVKASNFSVLEKVLGGVVAIPLIQRAFSWYSKDEVRRSNQQHQEIVRAVADGDAERAERLTAEHIDLARQVLLAHFTSDAAEADGDVLVPRIR